MFDGRCTFVQFECLQIKEGKYNESIKILHGIPESSSSRAGLSLLACCYFYAQDFTNAAGYYELLVQMFPENNDYKLYHAQSLYQACLYDEALAVTEQVEDDDYKARVRKIYFIFLVSSSHSSSSFPRTVLRIPSLTIPRSPCNFRIYI